MGWIATSQGGDRSVQRGALPRAVWSAVAEHSNNARGLGLVGQVMAACA